MEQSVSQALNLRRERPNAKSIQAAPQITLWIERKRLLTPSAQLDHVDYRHALFVGHSQGESIVGSLAILDRLAG